MTEDEIGVNEAELLRQLEQKRKLKTAANLNVTEAKKAIESVRDAYDILVAEDKVMEKIFRFDCGWIFWFLSLRVGGMLRGIIWGCFIYTV